MGPRMVGIRIQARRLANAVLLLRRQPRHVEPADERELEAKVRPRYYSFRYRDALFVVLNSEEPRPKEQIYKFSPEQQEWLRQTLAQNREVRWTFVFFHKPVWREGMGDPQSQGWTPIEEALLEGNRPYSVFVGHEHNYAKFVRHGRDYFMLATTGGGSKMRGVEYGEFDEVAWVTMKDGGPVVANILLEGVQPNDVRTARDLPRFETQRPARARRQQTRAAR